MKSAPVAKPKVRKIDMSSKGKGITVFVEIKGSRVQFSGDTLIDAVLGFQLVLNHQGISRESLDWGDMEKFL